MSSVHEPGSEGPVVNVRTPAESTIAARAGAVDHGETAPSTPPLYLTTAFDLEDLTQLDAVVSGQAPGYLYTRDGNPNHDAFASAVAELEGAEAGVVAASGMGALTAVLMSMLKSGDHVIAGSVLYGRTGQLLNHLATSFGIQVSFVEMSQPSAVAAARTPATKLCIAESIVNPLTEVVDLPAIVAALADVPLLVDNTFATPALLKPISHGATYVWHSASKYLNGHGDVMLGVVVGPQANLRKVRAMTSLYGLNSNPLEAWLATRGLKTLTLRMRQVSQSALAIAEFLQQQPAVQKVWYPGLPTHASYDVARRLLHSGCGGMLAFELHGGRMAVDAFFRKLAGTIPFSPTLADTRTTLSYPAGTSHKFMTQAERDAAGISDGLVRLSVGLEDPEDLQQELAAALA